MIERGQVIRLGDLNVLANLLKVNRTEAKSKTNLNLSETQRQTNSNLVWISKSSLVIDVLMAARDEDGLSHRPLLCTLCA